MKTERPYGSWQSPVTSDLIVGGTVKLSDIQVDGDDVYWLEQRPAEGGRGVIVKMAGDGTRSDLTPKPFNVRTRVHEYGGGAYLALSGTVFFVNNADQRIYRLDPGKEAAALTPASPVRYADGAGSPQSGFLYWVMEDHSEEGMEPLNSIVAVDKTGRQPPETVLCGKDFFAAPRLSPDGTLLAWLSWSHPNMPWDATELWVGRVGADGNITPTLKIAGDGDKEESVCQPEWAPDGSLYFVSDRTGFWNLYRWRDYEVEPVTQIEAEFGRPHWVFAWSSYCLNGGDGEVFAAFAERGIWSLGRIDGQNSALTRFDLPYTDISYVCGRGGRILFRGGSALTPQAVLELSPSSGEVKVLRQSIDCRLDPELISRAEPLEYLTADGTTAHAFFYPPLNPDFCAAAGELPPLLVKSHGGPTSAADSALKLEIQYWTSRGFAVVDVNYRGSTGYGTGYRNRLRESWGLADVEDVVAAARFLSGSGRVDPARMAVSGGSAGGYTTLCALTFYDVFKAGASYYGVSDLTALVADTHKFEARYLDRLIGPYPDRSDLYEDRSPARHADRLSCPVIFFQGLEDRVVPPAQTEIMVAALRKHHVPVAYISFEGEQHGFRKAENIKRALDAELYFYSCIFKFEPAGSLPAVAIDNLATTT